MADLQTFPSDLPPDDSLPQRRQWAGWIFLGFIFAALIAIQAASYFTRTPGEPLRAQESQLRTIVGAKSFAGSSPTSVSLEPLLASLSKLKETDPNAERLWVIANYEAHSSVPALDIDKLKASKVDDAASLARLYSGSKLTSEQARLLTKTFGEDPRFSTRLARIHAMERAGLPSDRKSLSPQGQILGGLLLLLLTAGGLVLWIIFLLNKGAGTLPAEGHPAEPLTIRQADAFALRAAQLMGSFVVIPLLIGRFTPIAMVEKAQFFAEVGILIAVFLLTRVPVEGELIPLSRIGFRKDRLPRDIFYGICATAMNFPIIIGLGLLGKYIFQGLPEAEHPIQVQLEGTPSVLLIVSLLFAASVAAPIFEEVLFRGTFLPAVSRVARSPVWGAVITSILFATIHPTGIPAWPGLAALGAMSCLLAYQTKSLVPSMVMHGLNNAIALGITILMGG